MKRTVKFFAALVAIYAFSFLVVRWRFHSTSSSYIWKDAGFIHQSDVEHTSFWIPYAGGERHFKQALFWVFLPAGRIDQALTGRVYDRTDARKVIIDA
jgi:hypothetical protein